MRDIVEVAYDIHIKCKDNVLNYPVTLFYNACKPYQLLTEKATLKSSDLPASQ